MKNTLLFFIVILAYSVNAQVITTDPIIVTESGVTKIIFDATQGTQGLKNYSGDVYAHTGVITSKSTSNSDWKYVKAGWNQNIPSCKMVSVGNNKWELTISPDIRTFYNIADATETVKQLALVFRSSDGQKEGKDTGGKDIFVDVHKIGLNVKITDPTKKTSIVEVGKSFHFAIQSSQTTAINCKINGVSVKNGSNISSLGFDHIFNQAGNYEIIAEAGNNPEIVRDTVYVIARPNTINESRQSNIRPGINIKDETTVSLCLYAPEKNFVYLIGDFNDWTINNDYLMKKDGDYWWITLPTVKSGQEYAFQYLVDGELRIADPYTDKILDPWNDSYISSSVYPDLKAYPTGKTEGIVSVFQTAQADYKWETSNFQPVENKNLVIYEMLIRDFIEEHSFKAAIGKLDYLKKLGINAIELMPVNEFEGNSSWGYNPSFYFAVDKYYGKKNDLKFFVDECHKRGIAVIVDMVLNHSFGQSPLVQLYWDNSNQAPATNNPWYNVSSPNTDYYWGYDFNHEKVQTQALVDSINSHWMKEYKIDGFRFDFTKGFTQKPGNGWDYDASRISILKRMNNEIRKRNPKAIVIFEHLTTNSEELELAAEGILLWGNLNNSFCQASMGYSDGSDLSDAIYSKRGFQQPNLLAYMESHDEERTMYKNLQWGNASAGYSTKDLNTALKRSELSACFYFLIPGPKMIWQFGELGYDYSINQCEDGTNNSQCRTAPKPLKWDYFENPERKNLYNSYVNFISLKEKYPVFSSNDFTYSLNGLLKYFVWKANEMNAFIVGNFDVNQGSVTVNLPKADTWYDFFSGEVVSSTTQSLTLNLKPGEYRLFTNKSLVSGNVQILDEKKIFIYPNPVNDVLHIVTRNITQNINKIKVDILDISCKSVIQQIIYPHQTSTIHVTGLKQGVYFLKANNEIIKFIKK